MDNLNWDQDRVNGYIIFDAPEEKAQNSFLQNLVEKVTNTLGLAHDKVPTSVNNPIIKDLAFEFSLTGYSTGYLKIADKELNRWMIPKDIVPEPEINTQMRLDMWAFEYKEDPFEFSFGDNTKPGKPKIITTVGEGFIFTDKLIQMNFVLPSQRVFGLGERLGSFKLTEGEYVMFTHGQDIVEDTRQGGDQGYGAHPFILYQTEEVGQYAGMWFRNSNPQSAFIKFNNEGGAKTTNFQYNAIGGIVDIYFFFHGTPEAIVKEYHNAIGKPYLPPFWALGWHQASEELNSLQQLKDAVKEYKEKKIPLESLMLDVQYMDKYRSFTIDQENFRDLNQWIKDELHKTDLKIVPVIHPVVDVEDQVGMEYFKKNSIKSIITGESLVGTLWPDKIIYPDFFKKDTQEEWKIILRHFKKALFDFDGLWIDGNEFPNWDCDGECPEGRPAAKAANDEPAVEKIDDTRYFNTECSGENFQCYVNQEKENTYYLPFIPYRPPQEGQSRKNLDYRTLSLNATHVLTDGEEESIITELEAHNLNGHMSAKVTAEYLREIATGEQKERTFLLSSSTFPSSGRFTSHTMGRNQRSWEHMKYSISSIMNSNMFGIAHAGADVCGFHGIADVEMCGRWMQLATFYPFARNHNGGGNGNQAPFSLGIYTAMAKAALEDRSQYLRYMYSLMY